MSFYLLYGTFHIVMLLLLLKLSRKKVNLKVGKVPWLVNFGRGAFTNNC